MNAPISRSALTARATASSMPKFTPPATQRNLTIGHIDNYTRCLAALIHVSGQAVKIQQAERDLNRVDLFGSTENIRAHCALGIEKLYRLLSDDSLPCDAGAARARLVLRAECAHALGFA